MIIRHRIKLTRSWSSDQDYITESTNVVALTQSWEKQVLWEFNDCWVSHPERKHSVLTLDSKVTLCVEGNDVRRPSLGCLSSSAVTWESPPPPKQM